MKKRRSTLAITISLLALVKPLLPVMILAVCMGVAGYLCAIFLTIAAGYGILFPKEVTMSRLSMVLVILAVMRGILHYGEQYCNHYIAFKLLAIIRHKVFAALRQLCPAKLEGRDKGNLISIITSDIELLEVFYAHTLSPIAIAFVTSSLLVIYMGSLSPVAALIALAGYLLVGVAIPLVMGRAGAHQGVVFREEFGELNSFALDSLRGLDETIQYGSGDRRLEGMKEHSRKLSRTSKELNNLRASQQSVTNTVILLFSTGMALFAVYSAGHDAMSWREAVLCILTMMGSFGPVVALSNLSNNLHQTLACAERVLSILEETPQVMEVTGQEEITFDGAAAREVTFSYGEEKILEDFSITIPAGNIIGIHGNSGCGKSTLIKLFMRFWDVQKGQVKISGRDVRSINTDNLRDMQSYVTQETCLFHDTIGNNIRIGRQDATVKDVIEAAKKASIHDYIMTLPKGYDSEVGELGDTLSGGEKQRIGIARAFLHDAPFLLLDEPTSNLDSLNEGVILKAVKESCRDKTVLLVSHRKSTMNLADTVIHMESERVS